MTHSFQGYYRTADELPVLSSPEKMGGSSGFFRVGENVVAYGAASRTSTTPRPMAQLPNVLEDFPICGGRVRLPFDLDEVTNNLRSEVYAGHMEERNTRLGSNHFVRTIYYWTRPILPVSIWSGLPRIKLRSEPNNKFPKWPVDRSVDILFEKTMMLAVRANGGHPIPFIWFWPEDKHAAFIILTHDVEDEIGKVLCPSLMDIDDEYGFKLSFEIRMHDLNHDGNLYRERSEFRRRAQLINNYCKEFGTEGFRSGVLHRNLLWYGDYQFSYDMSVPNVAQVDPPGGGCCTVILYFIGYVLEISITATQDYSLFHILRQYSIDLGRQSTFMYVYSKASKPQDINKNE
jgi:hypothetical protein